MLNLMRIMPNIGKVLNIKLGHTTNSSSTHYMLWVIGRQQEEGNYPDDWGFGWYWKEYGTLKEKRAYGIAQIIESFRCFAEHPKEGYYPEIELDELIHSKTLEWVCNLLEIPEEEVKEIMESGDGMYVDHQSVIGFPHVKGDEDKPNIQFIREWWEWIQRPEVIIYTWSHENDDKEWGSSDFCGDRKVEFYLRTFYAVKDEEKWVLFNKKSGTRLIITFDENFNKDKEGDNNENNA